MHPWHDVELAGKVPQFVPAVIEVLPPVELVSTECSSRERFD